MSRFRGGCVLAAALVVDVMVSGCGAASSSGKIARTPAEQARADAGVQPYTTADVRFMQGMIHHHAQAVVMARLAPTHGASEEVKILASRIDVGQRDEIAFMERWLRQRHEILQASMPGMSMPDTLMPGMLTPQQMSQLSAARGPEFDRLFLRFMIQHHRGALTMVDQLFSFQGAGQELYVFRFASDVSVDQTTEIDRMRGMLAAHATAGSAPSPAPDVSTSPSTPDPRVGLRAGWMNAGEAIWNLDVVSKTPPSEKFINLTTPGDRRLLNSDIAFAGHYAIEGNFSGYQVWDISNPRQPRLHTAYVCPGSQSDVSVYRNLMFVSSEATNARVDCGMQGVPDTVSKERARGIRIFDISDIGHPKYLATVQTCRGSHTHTVVPDLNDSDNIYVYVSGAASIRSPSELEGCSGGLPDQDPNSVQFRIEVIRVPLARPEEARVVSSPRIFDNLAPVAKHGESAADSQAIAAARAAAALAAAADTIAKSSFSREDTAALAARGPTQCHDITVYPAIGLAGGACRGYGLLLDIRDVANPKRIAAVADSNFSFWHSATFNNDGSKILFSDEWGGGLQPRCRTTDKPEWGADAIFTLADNKMTFKSYYKMPAPQTPFENCVAHNGSLIPVPGRDIMAQAWYQGGLSVFDWTDPAHPKEIAYFDRGPMDSTKLVDGGYWSTYWYNGYIVASELSRGLDMFRLKPSAFLSQNEIDAAESVHFDYLNVQDQPKFVWPASFVVVRAYLDQLVRGNGISRERSSAVARDLDRALKSKGATRRVALMQLATQLEGDASTAADSSRVRAMTAAVRELAGAQR